MLLFFNTTNTILCAYHNPLILLGQVPRMKGSMGPLVTISPSLDQFSVDKYVDNIVDK